MLRRFTDDILMCCFGSIRTSSHSQMGKITLSSSEKTIIGNGKYEFSNISLPSHSYISQCFRNLHVN